MSELKKGDRVKVTIEGEVSRTWSGTSAGDLGYVDVGESSIRLTADGVTIENVTVEKLPDPEPVWLPGDVVSLFAGPGWDGIYSTRVLGRDDQWRDGDGNRQAGRNGYDGMIRNGRATAVIQGGKVVVPS